MCFASWTNSLTLQGSADALFYRTNALHLGIEQDLFELFYKYHKLDQHPLLP